MTSLNKKWKVLVCDPISEKAINLLLEKGLNVKFYNRNKERLDDIISEFDIIIVRSATKVTKSIIDKAVNLKIIARAGAGLDNIDVKYATTKGIRILNSPISVANAVAELTIGLIIALLRRIPQAYMSMKEKKWRKKECLGYELEGKTLGIIGLGNIGSRVAIKAKGLGLHVIGYKRTKLSYYAKKLGIEAAETLDNLLRKSDIITLHVPLTPDTYHMIDASKIDLMKDGAYLINTSRGGVIDGRALLKALDDGKIAGAALDVWENEPPKYDWEWKLAGHPKVIPTPHIGAMTVEAQNKAGVYIAEKILREIDLIETLKTKRD